MILEYILTSIGAVLFIIFLDYLNNKRQFWRNIFAVPGPTVIPFFGNILDVANIKTRESLYGFLRKMNKDYGDTWRLKMLHFGTISIANPEDIELILSSSKHIDKGEIYRALQPWLCFGLLTSTETAMGTRLDPKDTAQKQYIDAINRYGQIALTRVLRPWLYIDWIYHNFIPLGREEVRVTKILHNFSMGIIKGRQVNFKPVTAQDVNDDEVYGGKRKLAMLDLLLTAKSEGADIDDVGIREEVDTFMFEGHDTTSMSLCFTLMLIANHPNVQDKLLQEMDEVVGHDKWPPSYQDLQQLQYMERCIKESLRLYPSVHYISRQVHEDVDTKTGYVIPGGSLVHIQIYDIHRNPKIYPDPLKYDPDRFLPEVSRDRHPFAFIPFSAGPRNCIGQRFAFLEMKTVLMGILRKYTLLPVDKPENMVIGIDFILRSKNGINVQFRPRKQMKL